MAAETAQIKENDTVAVWGCGPVGQFAIASAFMLGAARVIAIDRLPERLEMARSIGAITVDYSEEDVSVLTALKDLTGGIGPDSCIDAVGLEAHSAQLQGIYDKVKTAVMLVRFFCIPLFRERCWSSFFPRLRTKPLQVMRCKSLTS
jgi:threonine dehydrogenase-like Zn-dependent dehydrogenase